MIKTRIAALNKKLDKLKASMYAISKGYTQKSELERDNGKTRSSKPSPSARRHGSSLRESNNRNKYPSLSETEMVRIGTDICSVNSLS